MAYILIFYLQATIILFIHKAMQTIYSPKKDSIQRINHKAVSILDSSSQSESLQRKADIANNAAQRAEAPRPNNTGMPDNLKSGIESLSGFSMDEVRVHYNSSKPATVQALAYTQGTDIHVAPGQEKHLPHEAWHVAQQMAGRVSPTTNINGMPINDNAGLEHEADVMGEKAVQMKSDESKTVQRATIWNGVAQRVELENYYYHISDRPIEGDINTRHATNPKNREVRGDDLGPGFYMGDFDFLKYYYGRNFTESNVYIYYIEKNLIDETMKENIMDFTKKQTKEEKYNFKPDELFQIAMQLGFRYVDENDVFNHQRPLDLLPLEETEFKKCVESIYKDEAKEKINFFNDAKGKSIWKGYLNDIDQVKMEEEKLTITKKDIVDYFNKCGINEICANCLQNILTIDSSEADYGAILNDFTDSIKNELYNYVNNIYKGIDPKKINTKEVQFSKKKIITTQKDVIIEKFKENIKSQSFAEGLANALPNNSKNEILLNASNIKFCIRRFVVENSTKFLNRKKQYTYNSLEVEKKESEEERKVKPIQIAIRNDVDGNNSKGAPVKLLKMIVHHRIQFTRNDDNGELEIDGSKTEFETEILDELKKMEHHN